jgi:hypothetical protein
VASAIDHEDDLRVSRVSHLLVRISAARAAFGVVPADLPRFQPRAIDGRQGDALHVHPIPQRSLQHGVEHLVGRAAAFWKVV